MFRRRKRGALIRGVPPPKARGYNSKGGTCRLFYLDVICLLKFYDVDLEYANYLRNYDGKVPYISYDANNKFVCGIVLDLGSYKYFVPVSSNKNKQKTNLLICDDNKRVLSSLKFSFMFPAPLSVVQEKDFSIIKLVDPNYAALLEKEYLFCRNNEDAIFAKARQVYKIGCNPNHVLNRHCCNFSLLERKQEEWMKLHQD